MIEVDAREDEMCVCMCMCVYVRLKDGLGRTVETVKNEIEPPREIFSTRSAFHLPARGRVRAGG